MAKPMTPTQIKHALEDAGSSQADIARICGNVSRTAVHLVIYNKGTSQKIRKAICSVLQCTEAEIWGGQCS